MRRGLITYLRPSINGLQGLPGQGVPESYGPVSSSSPGGQDAMLVRGPGYRLDGGRVIRVALNWSLGRLTPNE